ncbi:endonuclease/exonuclease/phosphatase family protein [Dinoroseobacter sp. S375]|uniref:endonuclease/exonuclease/phosphatase family protein n=1 Tax=Dinoroseobacter sp. S375 TaxID=3415136 RepID=UPI003C7B67CF
MGFLTSRDGRGGDRAARLCALVFGALLAFAPTAQAETIRIAYFHTELSAKGPGLLLRDLLKEKRPKKLDAVLSILSRSAADIVVLGGIDYDAGGQTLRALQAALTKSGLPLPHAFAGAPNTGVPTGYDLDGDGRREEPEDAQAFGEFRGAGGLAVLSRYPILRDEVLEFSGLLWSAFPAADLPVLPEPAALEVLRLSSTGHWDVPILLPNGSHLHLLPLHATPPVFDGPEDRNGRRNADQQRFWADYLNGWTPAPQRALGPQAVVIGTLNADPQDGEARPGAVARLRSHPKLQDPAPTATGAAEASARQGGVNMSQRGDPALDTVDWPDDRPNDPGNLRVDYILPSRTLSVAGSGLHWPEAAEAELLEEAETASRHRLIWVDLAF